MASLRIATCRAEHKVHLASGLLVALLGLCLSEASADTTTVSISSVATRASDVPATMFFPITRSGDTSYAAVVNYHTVDGSAVAVTDYMPASGSITLPAGTTSATIPVTVNANPTGTVRLDFQVLLDGATGIGPVPEFATQHSFAAGMGSFFAVAADINGDGKPDLIVANQYGHSVSVMLNTAPAGATVPTFTAKVDFAVGASPQSVTVADINGDGMPDLIAANYNDNTLSVLLNTTPAGTVVPSFAAQQTFVVGTNPQSVKTADINGDGKADLVVSNNDNTVSILLNTTAPGATAPSFAAQQSFPTAAAPVSVAVADIDGDGRPDVVTANYFATVSVLLNTTAPGASTPSLAQQQIFYVGNGNYPYGLAIADINGDGKRDVAVSNFYGSEVTVLLNTTASGATTLSFSLQTFTTEYGGVAMTSADFNGDGKPDLVTANQNVSLAVLLNITVPGSDTANFAAPLVISTAGMNPEYVAPADINNDGKPDLLVANLQSDTVSVLINTTPAATASFNLTPQQAFATGSGTNDVIAADLNGDGRPDLVTTNPYDHTASILVNTGAPGAAVSNFTAVPDLAAGYDPSFAAAADLNGDGKVDLIFSSYAQGILSVYMNSSPPGSLLPTFGAQQTFVVPMYAAAVEIVDINLDGKPDVLVGDSGGTAVSLLINTTAPGAATLSLATAQSIAAGDSPGIFRVGDLNGDGKPDIVAILNSSDSVRVMLNTSVPGTATPSFTAPATFATGSFPQSLTIVDINGDGKPDLVTGNSYANSVSVLRNATVPGSMTPKFARAQDFGAGMYPFSVAASDMDGDGKADVVVADFSDGADDVLLNTTAAGSAILGFAEPRAFASGAYTGAVATPDVNGDGKPDLVFINDYGASAYVRLNTQYLGTTSGSPATGTILPERIFANGFE